MKEASTGDIILWAKAGGSVFQVPWPQVLKNQSYVPDLAAALWIPWHKSGAASSKDIPSAAVA